MSTTALRPMAPVPKQSIYNLHAQKGIGVQKNIRCDVVFGSPSLGCRGTGVCKITAYQPANQTSGLRRDCKKASGFISAGNGGTTLNMMLPKGFLCVNILRNHFKNNSLELKEPCVIPSAFQAALGLKIKMIPPGIYSVTDMEHFLHIDFK